MSMTRPESVPQIWDDQRDNDFFRLTASLFSPDFVYGAGVLLAANDVLDELAAVAPADVASLPVESTHTADVALVRVRRGYDA
jgi:hypothetical protein